MRVVLTVQRFAWSANQAKRSVTLLSDPARRAILVQDIVDQLAERDVDGVNLDFEPVPAEVRPEFVDFVRELRAGLDARKRGLQLTFDTTTSVPDWDLAALTADDAADAALIMGYDYRVATAPTAGSVSPPFSIDAGGLIVSLDEALAMVPSERVILALPWYGRAWSTFSDEPDSATLNQRTYGESVTVEYGDLRWTRRVWTAAGQRRRGAVRLDGQRQSPGRRPPEEVGAQQPGSTTRHATRRSSSRHRLRAARPWHLASAMTMTCRSRGQRCG